MWQCREDPEASRAVDAYIAQHYYHMLQISDLCPNLDGKTRIFTILQLIIYVFTLVYHLVIIMKSTIPIYEFNMVLFCENVHFCLLTMMSLFILICCLWKNSDMFRIHLMVSRDFCDYKEPPASGEELLRSTMKTEIRRFTLIPIGAALAAGVVLVVSPRVDFKAGSFDLDGAASMFDYQFPHPYLKFPYYVEDGFGYYSSVLGQLAVGSVLAAIIGGVGSFFINLAENVVLQLNLLNNSLDNIENRIEHLYSKLFGKMNPKIMNSLRHDRRYAYCYTKCLRKNFEHHQIILKY